ncbi:hypothetical protein B566_EDAN014285 [Ephemera danica]|nr:hypothetical protein B566_EDAN014285 [Ephemera danica]
MNQDLGALTIPAHEGDDKVREAEIFIYKTDLSGIPGDVAKHPYTPAAIEARAKHWQLWSLKDSFVVLSGLQFGGLQVEKTDVSPKQLHKIAQTNHLNDTQYNLITNNCQNWAIEACRLLRYPTRENIMEWAKSYYKENLERDFCVLCLHPKSICPFRGDHSLEDDYPFTPYTTKLGYRE